MKRRNLFAAGAALFAAVPHVAYAQERLRISLETNPNHVRNLNTERFVGELKKRAGGRVQVEVFPSAQLYRDRDLPRALRQGSVEMGIPGFWHLDGITPAAAITSLPMFYGVAPETVYRVVDGRLGQEMAKRFEDRLRVKVLGKWFDLGYTHLYGAGGRKIRNYDDVVGLKVRHPGGTANAERLRLLGANPVLIPWPDVPLAMNQGVMDGLITTHESSYTAKLWDAGMSSCFEDRQYFSQYIPMVGLQSWNKLSPELQGAMTEAWQAVVDVERREAAEAQDKARGVLKEHGVTITEPEPAALEQARKKLMAAQDNIVNEMKIDRDLVDVAAEELRAAGVQL
jgi:TRAP-type transport system periplasmic protein